MEKCRICIFPVAQSDMREMVDYLNTLSPEAALTQYDFVIRKIHDLATMPERRPLCRDVQLRLRGYRMLTAKNYGIFYVINGNTVEIRRILYYRRQYETLV